jgi:myo-inositol 2-dehydrogenase / D-chiro-inositol 1-dehydrogenase
MQHTPESPKTRRDFLRTSTVAAAGALAATTVAFPYLAKAVPNSDRLRIGFIGCGGRGTGAASQALNADSNVVLHAMGDIYDSQIERSLEQVRKAVGEDSKLDVPKERRFVGLDAYEKVLHSGVDVVILTTPPGFRPQHFKAAVELGKHVFLEKPMATDVPGIRSVMASVEEAQRKNLAVVAGFCWRYDYARREFYKRIHEGAIGEVRSIYATYLTGPVKPMPAPESRPAGMSDVEWQVKNWYNFVWTCGDGLVEQAIHSVDKILWAMKDAPPLKCTAVGGRMIPNHEGNIYDHIEVNYEWDTGVRAFMAQRQIPNCHGENSDYLMGTEGNAYIARGQVYTTDLKGAPTWRYKGPTPNMYQVEHDEMYASIRAGRPLNDGVRMCSSTLAGIMGRMAAYTGQEISWEQALNSKEQLVPENLDWNGSLPVAPMAVPGRTKYV